MFEPSPAQHPCYHQIVQAIIIVVANGALSMCTVNLGILLVNEINQPAKLRICEFESCQGSGQAAAAGLLGTSILSFSLILMELMIQQNPDNQQAIISIKDWLKIFHLLLGAMGPNIGLALLTYAGINKLPSAELILLAAVVGHFTAIIAIGSISMCIAVCSLKSYAQNHVDIETNHEIEIIPQQNPHYLFAPNRSIHTANTTTPPTNSTNNLTR